LSRARQTRISASALNCFIATATWRFEPSNSSAKFALMADEGVENLAGVGEQGQCVDIVAHL
jgi:hypothetical protein